MGRHLNATPTVRQNGANGLRHVQVTLRIPPALHEAAKHSALESGRSLNAEILTKLAVGLGDAALASQADGQNLLQQIADDLRAMRQIAERGEVVSTILVGEPVT